MRVAILVAIAAWAFVLLCANYARADESAALFFLQDEARQEAQTSLPRDVWETSRVIARGVRHRTQNFVSHGFSAGGDIISEAQRHLGQGNFMRTGRAWCADFTNYVLRRTGHHGSGSAAAISFARYGQPTAPRVGAIAVMRHHVGIVVGFKGGNPVLLSGNHGHRVGVGAYSARKILAYRSPV